MGTQLFIYKVKNLDYAKNMIIEDLESFLTNEATLMYQDLKFQFLPLASVKTIKIDLSSATFSSAEAKQKASALATLGTYIKTINKANADAETFVAYYYITSASYVAEKTILFTLTLDVLNSFYNDFKNKFTNRTRAMRQHKDRFWNRSFGSGYYVRRFYDTNEGFNPPKFLSDKLFFSDDDSYGLTSEAQKFYLIDKTPSKQEQEQNNDVINSYITFDNFIQSRKFVIGTMFNNVKSIIDLGTTDDIFVIDARNNPTCNILVQRSGDQETWNALKEKTNARAVAIIGYVSAQSKWYYRICNLLANGRYELVVSVSIEDPETWLLTNCQFVHVAQDTDYLMFMSAHPTFNEVAALTQSTGFDTNYVADYSVVDTSDYTINNIFVLPYAPINLDIQYLMGQYVIKNTDLTIDIENKNLLRIKDNTEFYREWNFIGTSISAGYLAILYENNLIVKLSESTSINLESRLFGSEFFNWGIWFAGEQVLINNEKFSFISAPASLPSFKLKYKVSNSFSGHFLFKMEFTGSWESYYKGLNDPEDLTLFVSKDNRAVLYQNAYLDYRRTMQQYDKEALAIAQQQTWFNVGSSIANSLLMSGIAAATGSPVRAGLGLVSSISGQLGNAIFAQINNENSLRQKEASLAAQRSSIRAGADISLQETINGNKLYFVRYSVGDQLKTNLYNYFRLYGYACNDYGIPNLQSRKLYNYIECEADFDLDGTEIYLMYLTNIKEKFKNGCTIFHKYNNTRNLLQNNENWEVWYNE